MNAYAALAIAAGAMLPAQAAVNARLARALGSPVWAAAVSGLLLTVTLALVATIVLGSFPKTGGLRDVPWWAWTGGFFGAVVLSAATAAAPRLGTASMVAWITAGQIVCSLVLDRFGMFGLQPLPLDGRRLAAAALVIAGAVLMR